MKCAGVSILLKVAPANLSHMALLLLRAAWKIESEIENCLPLKSRRTIISLFGHGE